jgi:ParB family transcriptional regulator, chromosome partitioning protein
MSEPRRGLGKGLGALISGAQAPAPDGSATPARASTGDGGHQVTENLVYLEVPPSDISPNPRQPRTDFDPDALAELVHSIKEIGLLQPVVVRRGSQGGTPFELIAGERRWRACQEVGLTRIPVIVRDTDDDALLRDALLENLHRSALNPLEEAAAYQQLMADFGGTQEELAARLGRSRPQVANTLRLLKLPPAVQRRVASGVVSAGHAKALLGLDDPQEMERLAERIVAEGLSVRNVEEIVLVRKGVAPKRKRTSNRSGQSPEMIDASLAVETRLGDRLETTVSLTGARTPQSRGKISIEFADLDDLLRILDALDPPS